MLRLSTRWPKQQLVIVLLALSLSIACGASSRKQKKPRQRLPDARLLLVTDLSGYLEPCGCRRTSLGGLSRLAAQANALQREVPTFFLVAGPTFEHPDSPPSQSSSDSSQSTPTLSDRRKAILESLRAMHVNLIAPPRSEGCEGVPTGLSCRVPRKEKTVSEQPKTQKAHAEMLSQEESSAFRVGPYPIRIQLWSDDKATQHFRTTEAAAKRTGADAQEIKIGIAIGSRKLSKSMARAGTKTGSGADLDFVVASGFEKDTALPPRKFGRSTRLHAGSHGQGITVVDLYRSPEGYQYRKGKALPRSFSFDIRHIELPQSLPEDKEVTRIVEAFNRRVRETTLASMKDHRAPDPLPGNPSYVGAKSCENCHSIAYRIWKTSPHGHAFDTLRDAGKDLHLECVGCHLTGYERPGGSTIMHHDGLEHVGCENCHGPASLHISKPYQEKLEVQAPSALCKKCHNSDHSDEFVYDAYIRRVVVPGHGLAL